MRDARPITERERHLIDQYSYWELAMTPQQFYVKWNVTYEDIALICSRSTATVQRWFY
ncbi:MAG: helix-turn-helix domain-containing protein, partial [Moorea sp. SIO3G5]|nr:helix-turn-helix domain-containing protein [Moorena sp. SIO3G5]